MYNILICDDERDIVSALKIYLESDGHKTFTAFNGKEAVECIEDNEIHLVLMDIMMPVMDGISAMVKIREKSNVPVILLTAKSEDIDKILGLEYGADDYITKPFNIREVTARIKAILRRVNPVPKGDKEKIIVSGSIRLDYNFRRVTVGDKSVELTGKEFDLLELLLKNPGKVYTRENLLDIAWGVEYPGDVRTVDVHIRRLREKIEENPAEPLYIMTKWGVGYYYKKD